MNHGTLLMLLGFGRNPSATGGELQKFRYTEMMSRLRSLNDRHQITLPPSVLREAGVGEGTYFAIHAEAGRIVLEPREVSDKGLAEEDWALLDRLVRRQIKSGQLTRYASAKNARKHLDRFG